MPNGNTWLRPYEIIIGRLGREEITNGLFAMVDQVAAGTAEAITLGAPAVQVENLTVTFTGRERPIAAVTGIDFSLSKGEILGVLGESGSGKSVMLRALLGMLPDSCQIGGRIRIDGRDIVGLPPLELSAMRGRTVSLIFQEPMSALDPVFRIGSQIAETIVRHEGVDYVTAERRALDLLELVAIPSAKRRLSNFPHELSGGMRQRAMIALALACRPKVLLADEPTTSLDVTVQMQILHLLRQLQREFGMAVVFVTHDIGVAAEISDRVAVMYAGRFVETGPVNSVIHEPMHPYTEGLLSCTVLDTRRGTSLSTIPGAPPDPAALPTGCSFAPRCRYAVEACEARPPEPLVKDAGRMVCCIRYAQPTS